MSKPLLQAAAYFAYGALLLYDIFRPSMLLNFVVIAASGLLIYLWAHRSRRNLKTIPRQ